MSLRGMDSEFVKCRTWGHEWEDYHPIGRRAAWGLLVSLRCVRCGMERHDTIDSLGELSARQYVQPPGYRLAVDERPNVASLRLEVVRRLRAEARQRVEAREQRRHSGKRLRSVS